MQAIVRFICSKAFTLSLVLFLVMSALAGAGAAKPQRAEAVSPTKISGTVIKAGGVYGNTWEADARVGLWYWSGRGWVFWLSVGSDAYGNYAFINIPTGYYYKVSAAKLFGNCWYGQGTQALYRGETSPFIARGTSRSITANVYMYFKTSWRC